MALLQIVQDHVYDANPGDRFQFIPQSSWTQYHFEVLSQDRPLIGVWKGDPVPGNGRAKNKPGQNYVDHKTGSGVFTVTVDHTTAPYKIRVTANSFWKGIFG